MFNFYSITIDIDWAPDFAISKMAQELITRGIKCTWFITHESLAIDELKKWPHLFELAWHPNFLSGSSHGKSERDVLDTMRRWLPNGQSVRAHCLVSNSRLLLTMLEDYGIDNEVSILLRDTPNIVPHHIKYKKGGRILVRIPFFWEDDIQIHFGETDVWQVIHPKYHVPGLKVFNFHPMYYWLNSCSMAPYETVKQIGPMSQITIEEMRSFVNNAQPGSKDLFCDLLNHIKQFQPETYTISEIGIKYRHQIDKSEIV